MPWSAPCGSFQDSSPFRHAQQCRGFDALTEDQDIAGQFIGFSAIKSPSPVNTAFIQSSNHRGR